MPRKPWKRVTINVTEEEYKLLCLAAGLEQLSLAGYIRYLLALFPVEKLKKLNK